MEKTVIHRDRQELQSADLNNMQNYGRDSIDHVVNDGIADGLWYTGFVATSTSATELSVANGRMYSDGAVFVQEDATSIDLFSVLPTAQQKKVLISAAKSTIPTLVEPRDFLIDVELGTTEPDSVAMQSLRLATVNHRAGSEASQPTVPVSPADEVDIAIVTLDSAGITGIEMLTANILPQARRNHESLLEQIDWRNSIGGQVDSLKTDLSNISSLLSSFATLSQLDALFSKLDEIQELAEAAHSMASTPDFRLSSHDYLLDESGSDNTYPSYDALVQEGIRFPTSESTSTSISLFNANDPDVTVANNWMLPKYEHNVRLDVEGYDEEHRINSYSSTSYSCIVKYRSRTRIRYGACFNWSRGWLGWLRRTSGKVDFEKSIFEFAGETWDALSGADLRELRELGFGYAPYWWKNHRKRRIWIDEVLEPYTERQKTTTNISGQGCAQSFLNSQPMWLTQVGLFFSQVDASGDVTVAIVECPSNNRPSLANSLALVTLAQADMNTGVGFEGGGLPALQETKVPIPPTYLMPGRRYAVVLLTQGDHYVALGPDQKGRTVGDFWFAENGELNLHPTARDKDMKMKLYAARFNSVSVEVDLNETTVTGGVESIDINADQFTPEGTRFEFEANIGGTWYPLANELPDIPAADLTTGQAVVQLRAKFQGTPDLMPALGLGSSRSEMVMANYANAFLWASEIHDVGASNTTQNIQVKVPLEYFDDAHHACTIRIKPGGGAIEDADTVSDVVQSDGTTMRTADFALAAPDQTFQVVIEGTTDNVAILYQVGEIYTYAAV